ncbi:MAG: hypothetical protein GY861_28305 [bacterium]|nr:hypothetical protein [bacterium]
MSDKKIDTEIGVPSESVESAIAHDEMLSPEELEAMNYEIDGDTSKPIKDTAQKVPIEKEDKTDEKPIETSVVEAKQEEEKAPDDTKPEEDAQDKVVDVDDDKPAADTAIEQETSSVIEKVKPAPQKPLVTLMDVMPADEVNDLKTSMDQASEDYQAGEIEQEEYLDAKYAYRSAVSDNEKAEKFNAKLITNLWNYDCDQFYADNADIAQNDTLRAAITSIIKAHDQTAEGKKLTNHELLAWGKEKAMKDLGLTVKNTESDKDKEKNEALAKAKKDNADRSPEALGEDIRNVPISQSNDSVDTGEFAHIDRLDGDAYQTAVDSLTPAQKERYENAA